MDERLCNVEDDVSSFNANFSAQQEENKRKETQKERDEILQWISPSNFPGQQADKRTKRQDGTGEWFLNSQEFKHWCSTPHHTLLCHGIPGAGKTMITVTAIDHLLNNLENEDSAVAYIYCSFDARDSQTAEYLLTAIIKQLLQNQASIPQKVKDLYLGKTSKMAGPSSEEVLTAFTPALLEYSKIFVVVDGLDECKDSVQPQLLNKIGELGGIVDLRLMVTSRFSDLEKWSAQPSKLEIIAGDEDISRFVTGRKFQLPRCVRENKELEDLVKDKIVKSAQGM